MFGSKKLRARASQYGKKQFQRNVDIHKLRTKFVAKDDDYLFNMSPQTAKELQFEDKQRWFKIQTDKFRIPWTLGADNLEISEKNIMDSALQNIKKVNLHRVFSPKLILISQEVKIVFEEEKKINDAGGLLREFTTLICTELFKKEIGLFVQADTEETYYSINPKSPDTQKNLDSYKLFGRILGKAIFEQIPIPIALDRTIIRQILGQEVILEDIATYDKALYKSYKYIKENKIGDDQYFQENFVVLDPLTGKLVELVTGGANMLVNDENKELYIKHLIDWLSKKSIQKKMDALMEGLYMVHQYLCFNLQVITKEFFQCFQVEEFEMMINGLPFIDINDWEANTIYKGSYYKSHQIVKWFWQVMRELDQPQLIKFFQFCTGSTRPPVEGFRGNLHKFTVESMKLTKENSGMVAHTCFNRVELPMYTSKEALKEKLLAVLKTDFNGVFGLE